MTIRERIDALLDKDTFEEIGMGAGDAELDEDGNLIAFSPANYVLGFGKIDGRRCIVGGTKKASLSAPVYEPHRFRSVAEAMARVPVAGMPAARLVASHFSVMSKSTAQVLIAGPAVVQRAMGEKKTKDELGGANVHTKNGTVDNASEDETDALTQIRRFLSYLPSNVWEMAPVTPCDDAPDRREETLLDIVPRDRRRAFDMRKVLRWVLDEESFFEIGKGYGRSQITGLARMNGQPVGVWANDGRHLAGAMTANGAHKARRFIELCETFHLPVLSFVDEPGFMIGSQAEREATIRHGAHTALTAAMANVP